MVPVTLRAPLLYRVLEFRHNSVVKFRPDVSDRHTRGAIVQLLLESGPITAGEIGDRLAASMSVKSGYSYFNATVGLLMLLTMTGNFQAW